MKYFLVFVSVILSSFVFAQNVSTGGSTLTENLDMGVVHNNQINKVVLKFCNNGFEGNQLTPSLDLVLRPNQKKKVCVALVNQSNDSLSIIGSVVPATINTNGNMLCSNNGSLTGNFVVSDFEDFSGSIILGPQGQIVKYFTLSTSDVASGQYYTCFTVNLTTSEKLSENSPFNLVVRKAGNIKVSVVGKSYRYQWFDDILVWLNKYARTIAKTGIIVCAILLVYSLIPMFRGKKKSLNKKPAHKK